MRATALTRAAGRAPAAVALLALCFLAFLAQAQAQNDAQTKGGDACDPAVAPGVALAPEEIAGKWQQTEPQPGESVEIKLASPTRAPASTLGELGAEPPQQQPNAPASLAAAPTNVTLHGSHDWDGTYADGKLVFKRKPATDEMSHDAPDWARQAVTGQIEWRLELEPKIVCGNRIITGKWFPGRIRIDENTDDAGNITAKTAKADGDGDPIAMRYEQQQPAIYGVVVLDDQTGFAAQGVPYHPYPYPEPAVPADKNAVPPREEFNPFAYSVYSREAEINNPNGLSQFQRQANGRLAIPGERRTLYVYGQGLPRDWKTKITIKPGTGADGLDYSVVALSEDPTMDESYRQMFRNGQLEAEKDLQDDSDALDLIRRSQAMLIRVDLHSGALPGIKDFAVNDIRGVTRWRLRFGDDRALISFGREVGADAGPKDIDLVDALFLPERTFIEVKTEVALPVAEIPLRVSINDQRVTWAGGDTLVAKLVPAADDPTRRTYRTASIELVEAGKGFSPAAPGLVFLPAKAGDEIVAKLDDEALFFALSRPTTVYRTPAALGMMWKDALERAAKVGKVNVTDWTGLPSEKAAEITSEKLVDVDMQNPYKASEPLKVSVNVGQLASLLWFRDEFVRRMNAAINNKDNFPSISDPALLRGLRARLQPDAWDPKSAWTYLHVTCPDGSSCPFSNVLSDDFLQQNFKDNRAAADQWMVKTMAEAVRNYADAAKDAINTAQRIPDDHVESLIGLLAQDCTSEALDLPCGYKALRPLLLPRMMRLTDLDNPQRYLWIPDLNARYVTRNLYTIISAVKAQQTQSSLSTQTGLLILTGLAAPTLSEAGMLGEVVGSAISAPGANTLITLATEIPEGLRAHWEVRFALGASLVFGQERLSEAVAQRDAWVNGLVSSLGQAIVQEVIALPRVGAELRTARILDEIEALRGQGYKGLDPKYRDAFLRSSIDAKVLEATGNAKTMSEFDKRVSADFDKVAEDLNIKAVEPTPAATVVEAKGDPVPKFEEPPPPPAYEPRSFDQAQQEMPIAEDQAESLARPAAPPEAPAKPAVPAATVSANLDIHNIPPGTEFAGFKVGQRLGEGADAVVYRIENAGVAGCDAGCVIKFYKSERAALVVADIEAGENALKATTIPQVANLKYNTEGLPYLIQPEIKGIRLDGLVKAGKPMPHLGEIGNGTKILFGLDQTEMDAPQLAFFKAQPVLKKAVLQLYRDLVDNGLIWEDGHLNNIYFEKSGGRWKAGVLDQDRLIKFSDRSSPRLGPYIGEVELFTMAAAPPAGGGVQSLAGTMMRAAQTLKAEEEAAALKMFNQPYAQLSEAQKAQLPKGPYFPNAEFFMEKALEYKGYLRFDLKTKTFIDGSITVDEIKQFFPNLGDPNVHAPIDGRLPHWWKTSMAAPAGGNVVQLAAWARDKGRAPVVVSLDLAA